LKFSQGDRTALTFQPHRMATRVVLTRERSWLEAERRHLAQWTAALLKVEIYYIGV
jgi:hypothetical protein